MESAKQLLERIEAAEQDGTELPHGQSKGSLARLPEFGTSLARASALALFFALLLAIAPGSDSLMTLRYAPAGSKASHSSNQPMADTTGRP